MDFPPSNDPLVRALQRLVEREGGWAQVAGADLSDQTIYQIVTCKVDSKTKRPKGVGPRVRRYLDTTFPGWLDAPGTAVQAREPTPTIPALGPALAVVLDAVGALSAGQWDMIAARVAALPGHPEMRDEVHADVLALLTALSGKRRGAG